MRTLNGGVELLVPLNDKIRQFVFTKGVAIQKKDGSMFPVHRKYLVGLTDLEIVSVYNAELRGICNYYGMASNFCKLHYLAYLMEYSCLKTLASKHKTSLSKTIDKFNDGTGKVGTTYERSRETKGVTSQITPTAKARALLRITSAMLPLSTDTQSIPLKTG